MLLLHLVAIDSPIALGGHSNSLKNIFHFASIKKCNCLQAITDHLIFFVCILINIIYTMNIIFANSLKKTWQNLEAISLPNPSVHFRNNIITIINTLESYKQHILYKKWKSLVLHFNKQEENNVYCSKR